MDVRLKIVQPYRVFVWVSKQSSSAKWSKQSNPVKSLFETQKQSNLAELSIILEWFQLCAYVKSDHLG